MRIIAALVETELRPDHLQGPSFRRGEKTEASEDVNMADGHPKLQAKSSDLGRRIGDAPETQWLVGILTEDDVESVRQQPELSRAVLSTLLHVT